VSQSAVLLNDLQVYYRDSIEMGNPREFPRARGSVGAHRHGQGGTCPRRLKTDWPA